MNYWLRWSKRNTDAVWSFQTSRSTNLFKNSFKTIFTKFCYVETHIKYDNIISNFPYFIILKAFTVVGVDFTTIFAMILLHSKNLSTCWLFGVLILNSFNILKRTLKFSHKANIYIYTSSKKRKTLY